MLFYSTTAQVENNHTAFIYFNHGDKISFRWVPKNRTTFQNGISNGYRLIRKTMVRNGKVLPVAERKTIIIGDTLIKPYTKERFADFINKEERASLLFDLIYEPSAPVLTPQAILAAKRQQELMFGLSLFTCDLSPDIAKSAGLYAEDINIQANERYLYSLISYPNQDTLSMFIVTQDTSKLPKPNEFNIEFGDKKVLLTWNTLLDKGLFSGYSIEKSIDNKTWTKVNKDLIVSSNTTNSESTLSSFQDSLKDNTTTYYYRLSGVSPFGVVSPPSDVLQGKGIETFTPFVVIDSIVLSKKMEAILYWHTNEPLQSKQVKGFMIEFSEYIDSTFKPVHPGLLGIKKMQHTDKTVTMSGFFRITTVGQVQDQHNISVPFYFHYPDDIPPTIPTALSAKVDTLGVVTLTWAKNKDRDILGYRLYASHRKEGTYADITTNNIRDTMFTDTLSLDNLSGKMYYKILAIDKNFNYSAHSSAVEVIKPDTIPPTAPQMQVRQVKNKTDLLFTPSYSTDIKSYTLSRLQSDSTVVIKEWEKETFPQNYNLTSLPDTLSEITLQLYAQDFNKNKSTVSQVVVKRPTNNAPKSKEVQFSISSDVGHNKLTWERQNNINGYKLYRKAGNNPLELYQMLDKTQTEFTDNQISTTEATTYKLFYY